LDVGHVSINDVIFPTADPRVPFGGCGSSGFGVTRGAEGLLAMTRPKVIARHRGPIYMHLMPRKESDFATLMRMLKFLHGGRRKR
jgi:aldehyde dehydrogenase (NAD+)